MTSRLTGGRPIEVLRDLGWRPLGSPPLHASVEMTAAPSWLVGRCWTTPASLAATPLKQRLQRVIVCVDGEVMITRGSEAPFRLTRQQMVVIDGAVPLTATTSMMWSWCEWQLVTPFHTTRRRDLFMQPLVLTEDTFNLMANTTGVFCTQPGLSISPGARALTSALNTTLYAAVLDGLGLPNSLSLTSLELLQRALNLIEARYRDSSFSVRELAEALSVHHSFLNRLFAHIDTTPRRALEERRVESARALLEAGPQRSRVTMDNVAHVSGFASVQQMRSALRRAEYEPPDA